MVVGMAMADAVQQRAMIACTHAMNHCNTTAQRASPYSSLLFVGLESGGDLVKPYTPLHTLEPVCAKIFLNMSVWGCPPR